MKNFLKILSLLFFVGFFLATRLPRMGTDTFNTDEVYWHERSQNFLNAIITKDYTKTFQEYHPGVILMWEFSLTALISSKVNHTSLDNVFNNWEELHIDTILFINIWILVLSLIAIVVLSKALKNWWAAFLILVVLNLEPFYLGNARLIHLDAQASIYILLALALTYLATRKINLFFIIASSFFLALSALTKSIFAGTFVFCLFAAGLMTFLNQGLKKAAIFFLTIVFFSVGFCFLIFPALWVAPWPMFSRIFNESLRVGKDVGHGQIFFGIETRDPGPLFYPTLFVIKTSIFMLFGTTIFLIDLVIRLVKNRSEKILSSLSHIPFEVFTLIFYLGYFVAIEYFSKKIDRYIVPIYPFLALAAVLGWLAFLKKRIYLIIVPVALFIYSVALPLKSLFPDFLLYNSPIFGDASVGNEIVGQKPFGIEVSELRDKIISRYGDKTKVAASDFETLRAVYPTDVVYNVLVEHPNNYKIMVLGPNKPFPPSLRNEPTIVFYKVDSLYINGLEFWRIYQKKVIQ